MQKGIVHIALIICCIGLFSACTQARTTYSLPADWPIPQLTVPAGAKITSVVTPDDMDKRMAEERPGEEVQLSEVGRQWYINVGCKNWQELIDHTESCLKPLDYREHWIEYPDKSMGVRDHSRTYYSPDLLTRVDLMNMGYPGGSSSLAFKVLTGGGFMVTVSIFETPPKTATFSVKNDKGVVFHMDLIE